MSNSHFSSPCHTIVGVTFCVSRLTLHRSLPMSRTGLLDYVRSTIERNHLLSPGDAVVVGVSGGPDSLCLLHLLLCLRDEYALRLHVAHLNHQLRGAEAE